ncbi:MAG: 1-deoxy-D-xylulose-5-phosphate synthase [Gammaproteobacteria bacterium AqS3]|nr:1-deoxy-D-xylulose-5-phosphate synthase [Gammaproteobacteria bacterium AqS3]
MQIFEDIPTERPATELLDAIREPADLRALPSRQLAPLADELREFLLWSLGRTGGHFGAGLGVIELTLVLHYIYNTPDDALVWDVGHQSYPHKILTGRREAMQTLRQQDGLAGFPKRAESLHDAFGTGHSSTSISAALGMGLIRPETRPVAVIGDGALTAGMAYEALCHAGALPVNLMVVLNDNRMSISRNIGAMSNYLSRLWAHPIYTGARRTSMRLLSRFPRLMRFFQRTETQVKGMMVPNTLFEELGFKYIGPVDGHNIKLMLSILGHLRRDEGPHLFHVVTRKGAGYRPAEDDPIRFHAIAKTVPKQRRQPREPARRYQDVFGDWLCARAECDERIHAITPAMTEGSGLVGYRERFPERFHDVAIAEQHALTLAAGMACGGARPVVAIYSTFLQRAYDQLIHDIALQDLSVLLALDRAGLVGEDGPTHNGAFDLSYLRCIPNIAVATPSSAAELERLLDVCLDWPHPAAVRYPRGAVDPDLENAEAEPDQPAEVGRARCVHRGSENWALLGFGTLLHAGLPAVRALGGSAYDMRFVAPLDARLIERLGRSGAPLVTLEENTLAGGAGSAVVEHLGARGFSNPVLRLGIPERFIDHASQGGMRAACGLDAPSIERAIGEWLVRCGS